jgi:hypothetical protein
MATAKNAKILIELGQTLTDYTLMSDAGDQQIFFLSGVPIWSKKSGYEVTVLPNGISSGRNLLSAGSTNDTARVAAFTAYSKGAEQSPSATSVTVPRPTTGGYAKIISVTMATDGSIDKVAGTEGAAFSETRNAAGGPPYIGVDDVEVGQVRITGSTAAALTADDLHQVVGTSTERFDYPNWTVNSIGDGEQAETVKQKNAYIKMDAALPGAHTAAAAKRIYTKYYEPVFSELTRTMDFSPAEESHTVTSQEYYRGTIGSVSAALGQGSFTALLNDGLTDALIAEKNQIITVKFFPDENKSPYALTQGKVGLDRTFPYDNQNQAEVTISAETQTAEFSS